MDIHDYQENVDGKLKIEIIGRLIFLRLPEDDLNSPKRRLVFVSSDFDCLTIGEMINACGYTTTSVAGRRVLITIQEWPKDAC